MINGVIYIYNSSSIKDIRGVKVISSSLGHINSYRIKNNCLVMCIKTPNIEDILCNIVYINNGGLLQEGFVKLKNKNKFKKMESQLQYFNVRPKRQELEILLSMETKESYNKYISFIVNKRIKEAEKKELDYKKLYNYWKNTCYSNDYYKKIELGQQYINISYDYKKIKESKKKLHQELLRNFKLYQI